jgi:acylphosphatase
LGWKIRRRGAVVKSLGLIGAGGACVIPRAMASARVHLLIHGRVQGVWYRGSTRAEATRLGLTGWVRNLRDGSVEAVAEGERGALEELLRWCRRGPPHAEVTGVTVEWEEATGGLVGFDLRRG